MRKPVPTVEQVKRANEGADAHFVRGAQEEAKTNEDRVEDQTESLLAPAQLQTIVESSNPTRRIRRVLDDLRRNKEGEEVFTPLRAYIDVDAECALATQLEEQGNLMTTEEVVDSFVIELDLEADYERVCS